MDRTATQLIYAALRSLAVLRAGYTPSADQMADALARLNEMLDSWSTERLSIHEIALDVWTLTAGKSEYTIGPGVDRPLRIEDAVLRRGGTDLELRIVPIEVWSRWSAAGEPAIALDGAMPSSRLCISPVPVAGDELVLHTWRALTQFVNLTTAYSLPPGYAAALHYGLAVELAPAFAAYAKTTMLLDDVREKAERYKSAIKSLNVPVVEAGVDEALLGYWR